MLVQRIRFNSFFDDAYPLSHSGNRLVKPNIEELPSNTIHTTPVVNSSAIMNLIWKHAVVSFSRSSGPGGQNVNKVNSKSELRLDLTKLDFMNDDSKDCLMEKYHKLINKNNEIIITSQSYR